MSKEIIAVFDFDGTLTTGMSSRLLFLKQLVGLPNLLRGLLYSQLQRINLVSSQGDGDYLDTLFLKGRDKDDLSEQALIFLQRVLLKKLRQEALRRLDFHQQQGHTCILVSGAWDIYLKPLAQQYDFNQLICTELEFDPVNNKSTGRMKNPYCMGQYKVDEFKKVYADRRNYILYAYGDSSHDLALLNYADYAFYKCFQ